MCLAVSVLCVIKLMSVFESRDSLRGSWFHYRQYKWVFFILRKDTYGVFSEPVDPEEVNLLYCMSDVNLS